MIFLLQRYGYLFWFEFHMLASMKFGVTVLESEIEIFLRREERKISIDKIKETDSSSIHTDEQFIQSYVTITV